MSSEAIEDLTPQLDAVDESPGAAALRARSYELLRAAQGALVVDVGCGAGRAVAELADQGVRAIGIDVNDQMIALAQERWENGEFRVGDARTRDSSMPETNGDVLRPRAVVPGTRTPVGQPENRRSQRMSGEVCDGNRQCPTRRS